MGLLMISFSTFGLGKPKCTETDLKKSKICPIWGQSDPNLDAKFDIPAAGSISQMSDLDRYTSNGTNLRHLDIRFQYFLSNLTSLSRAKIL